jgi:uncharacterized protein YigE (DUF2233 family)
MRLAMRRGLTAGICLLIGVWTLGGAEVAYRGTTYLVARISLYWLDPDGRRFGQLCAVQHFLEGRGRRVRLLMNAGIFDPTGTPNGLVIIDGKVRRPLNRSAGTGNFYLRPNGVFFVEGDRAAVRTTAEFAQERTVPRLAIQSGPLLLRGGVTHPAFRADSTSRLHRNGVGVRRDGTVLFAITEFDQPHWPNLWEFADFFRSQGCDDALFLDGDISQMVVDPAGPISPGNYFGAIFAVSEPR